MEAQLQRPVHGHQYEEDPQSNAGLQPVMEGDQRAGEYNQQGGKKSVLKKVKDKAKKLKDTIKKSGQGQEQEHEDRYDDSPEEEEEDADDEERVNDSEIHGAPMYESTVIRSTNLPMQVDTNLEKPNDTREDRYDPNAKDEGIIRPAVPGAMGHEMERPPAMELPTFENKNASSPVNPGPTPGEEANAGESRVKIGPLMDLEEDPHSPKNHSGEIPPSNYRSKVTDPTGDGGKEVEVAPLIRKFDNLNVDESGINPEPEQRSYTGSHDQFAPQPTSTKDQFSSESNPVRTLDNPESSPKSFDSNKAEGMPRDTITGKISSATSAITDKAVSAKNVVASKLGYGGSSPEGQDPTKKPVSESAAEYANIVSEKLAPVYEKVAGAGTAVLSKVQGSGGTENQGEGDTAAKGTDKGVTMTGYLAEKFRPGDEDKALSEAITDALHKKKEGAQNTGEEEQPMGKVTESEEVATSLGTGMEQKREGEDALAAGRESTGPGIVGRVKDAVSLWLGKSTGMQTAQDSINQSYVSDAGSDPVGGVGQGDEVAGSQQPRLQESSN